MSKSTDKQPSELSVLRAEFKALTGKNPSPSLNAEKLRENIAELKAAQKALPTDQVPTSDEVPPSDQAAEKAPPVQDPAGGDQGDQNGEAGSQQQTAPPPAEPTGAISQSPTEVDEASDETLAELGLEVGEDGLCGLVALTSMSGATVAIAPGDPYRRRPAMAVRHVRGGIGKAG